jgi:hypothetical protein
MDVRLILDIDEDHLDEAGYAAHHQVRDLWPAYDKSGVFLQPNTGLAMLEPLWEPRDAVLGEWEADPDTTLEHINHTVPGGTWDYGYDLLRIGVPGTGVAGVTSRYWLPGDTGRDIWMSVYGQYTVLPFLVDVFFGGRYRLRISSREYAILYRSPSATWASGYIGYGLEDWVPVATGNLVGILPGYSHAQFVLRILPLPGGFVVSTNQGQIFYRESDLGPAAGSGQALLPAPLRMATQRVILYWTDSAVTFPSEGTFSSPVLALPYSSSEPPSLCSLVYQPLPEGTSVSASLTKGDGSPPEPPMEDYKYSITLSTADNRRTPYYWATKVDFVPTHRTITGALIPVDTFIREIQERRSLDQPLGSLSFVASNKSGVFESYKGRANLPVRLEIGASARFTGATNLPTSEEGSAEWVTLECYDGWRRLQNALLSNAETYDGMAHSEVVRGICQRAGLPDSRLEIAFDAYPLPTSQDDEPLYRPANGQSAASFLEHIRDSFSGWRMGFSEEGKFFYRPASSDLTPAAFFHHTTAAAKAHGGPPAGHYPLFNLSQRVDQSQHKNEIWVVGQAQTTEEPLAAAFIDYSSLYDPTYAYYVGERRLLIWLDPSLNTQDAVNWVCRTLAEKYARFRVYQTFEAQFDAALKPESVIQVDDQPARIVSMDTRFSTKEQRTRYEAELQ